MVQRKVSNKLGIQADHVKTEKRLVNLKPASYQHQDGKNTGPDMKKKMKKSRSIKLSDIEGLRSSALKKTFSQPGKPPPPPLDVPMTAAAATPQKQTQMRASDGPPNYMKSTSSSEARKESSQVSSRNSQAGSSDSKNDLRRRSSSSNSKLSCASSNKSTRSLTRSSSLKLVRTLTKTPSFKHVRGGAKKCSRVVICADMNAQSATCSSTLKDSKFPDYLMLNPGGNEAEGTSATKVCPYTYCSLNGHHHKPLPPLKCFLSARRRLLKTQKSMKLEVLSPRRVKPVGEGADEFDPRQVIFDSKPAYKEEELDCSPRSPLIQEGDKDFFIKIYAKNKDDDAESTRGGCDEVKVEHRNIKEEIAEILFDGSSRSEINFDENIEKYSDIASIGVHMTEAFPEEGKVEDTEGGYLKVAAQTEGIPENTYNASDFEDESNASGEENDSMSEASDMEWEEGKFPGLELAAEANDSMKDDNESDVGDGYLSEINDHDLQDKPVAKSDNIVVNCSEKVLADEIFEEESACSEIQQEDSDSEMNDADQNLDDQGSSTEEAENVIISGTEEPIVEPTASIEEIVEEKNRVPEADSEIRGPQFGDTETNCTHEVRDETLNDQWDDKSLRDDDLTMWPQNQISVSFQDSVKTYQVVVIDEDYSGSKKTEDSKADQKVSVSGFDVEQEIPNTEAGDQMEAREQFVVTKRSIGVQVPDDLFEADEDDNIKVDDSNSFKDVVDDILPAENQEHPSEGEYNNTEVAENQKILENDEEKDEVKKFNIPSFMDAEEHSDSRMYKISSPESSIGAVETTEVADSTQSDTPETFPMTGCETTPELKGTSFPIGSKSKEESPSTCNNQKWAVGSKRAADDDDEEMRKFNPREPNFLPVVPDPDAEKVDLKHQMMDERKNSEEWMVDYALRQAVTKLAPARKKKVALLVEAFETVLPTPKWETRLRHSSAAFAPTRPIQACS